MPGMVLVLGFALGFGLTVRSIVPFSLAGVFLSSSVVFPLLVDLGLGLDVLDFSGLSSFF